MSKTFTAQIDGWIAKSEAISLAVVQTASQALVEDATLEQSKGGHMPVDTRFLLNSMTGAIGSLPMGPSDPKEDDQGNVEATAAVISKLKLGDKLYLGWAAKYAKYMNARYGFKDKAEQNWQDHVADAIKQVKRRIK